MKRPPKLEVLDAVFGGFSTPHPNNLILKMDLAAVLGHVRKGESYGGGTIILFAYSLVRKLAASMVSRPSWVRK